MPATVRLCLVDPAADEDEIVTAAVSMITTTYTAPSDRIMLADGEAPATGSSLTRRDRLVESVLRLGRGATATPDHRAHGDHESATAGEGLPGARGSGSGLGPRPGDLAEPVANPTDQQPLDQSSGPGSDDFALIIAGWSDHPADPFAMADWTPLLAPAGTIVALTHSSDQHRSRAAHSGQLSRAAALAGLILTDRMILAHQPPSPPRPTTRRSLRAIALGGHRRIHTTASVFRRSTPSPEVRHV
ncbi:hypothetical protein INP57_17865 [Saccharopolyspora sp. HNM0986]|uniref:hypothetical protein n=1 Tax=Saccharopolyspora galaxeae TaxID=2781241 RepID=UPI00190A115C|nr:hypothetical protein [Saccharopolyspora sp. HNM0986]MBK0868682.1 hypothetical protein [Saccharopolyspora sp. HNM0986]